MTPGYTRVTEVLYPFSGLQSVDRDLVAHAAERGSRVHRICESIVKGLGEHGVDDEIWGYVESFKKWWGDGKEVVAVEKRFYCDKFKITGQADLIIWDGYSATVIDYKTSSKPSKTWVAQAGAYMYLAQLAGIHVTKAQFIHLNKHGKAPKIHQFEADPLGGGTAIDFFFHCYQVYMHFYHKAPKEE